MTQQYSVSGTLDPDATTANTGPAAGTYNGQSYWSWLVGEQEWFLWWGSGGLQWFIARQLGGPISRGTPHFNRFALTGDPLDGIAGDYTPIDATGTATVAEYVAPPAEYAVLTINDGPLAGQYVVLKTR
jgi:hypothetical protein